MSRLIDISVPIRETMPTWPGSAGFAAESEVRREGGDLVTDTRIVQNLHVGSHIDAPLHFLAGGDPIDEIPVESCVGPAHVADLSGIDPIDGTALERAGIPDGTSRLLMRTDNGALWEDDRFDENYVAITPDASRWIVGLRIELVGIDYLSIQPFDGDPETHRILLRAGVIIVEGLDLRDAPTGPCELMCLPIRYEGMEAAPVRAIIRVGGSP